MAKKKFRLYRTIRGGLAPNGAKFITTNFSNKFPHRNRDGQVSFRLVKEDKK